MKVLGIQASGRAKGNTEILLKEMLKPFEEAGDQVEILKLSTLSLKHCTGCFGCNNKDLKCIIADDLEKVKEALEGADVLALGAPSFAVGAPSILKTVMDRTAAWALNHLAERRKPRYSAAVMVGGADTPWLSQQRLLPAEFLKLYNTRTIGMFTVQDTGLKGEILLNPEALERSRALGTALRTAALKDEREIFPYTEQPDRLHCPNCLGDAFHVDKKGHYTCAACHTQLPRFISFKEMVKNIRKYPDSGIFTPTMAAEHNDHIGNKISKVMEATEEVKKRSEEYFERDMVPREAYILKTGTQALEGSITWTEDGKVAFEGAVPKAFQGFVRKAIEKKALGKGLKEINREIFLAIKKESGN